MSGPEPSVPGSEPQPPTGGPSWQAPPPQGGPSWQAPPPQGGPSWQTPPPPATAGGFQTVPIAAGPAPGIAYADLVQRIIAYVIDGLILGFGYAIVQAILFTSLFITGGFGGVWIGIIVFGILFAVVSAVYFVYTWTTMRASPGQKILNLEVVRASDGGTLTQGEAIMRWAWLNAAWVLSIVFGYSGVGYSSVGIFGSLIGLLGFLYTLYLLYTASQDPKRQGFHDKQVGTVVIRRLA
ncbi:MAG TPA: RDD family protein [Candidatus Limnocylindrales bacterium]